MAKRVISGEITGLTKNMAGHRSVARLLRYRVFLAARPRSRLARPI